METILNKYNEKILPKIAEQIALHYPISIQEVWNTILNTKSIDIVLRALPKVYELGISLDEAVYRLQNVGEI